MTTSTQPISITRFTAKSSSTQMDLLSVEEPLEIALRYGMGLREMSLSVTMRTPGHDEELAIGFLLGEGIIRQYNDSIGVIQESTNRVVVILHEDVSFDPAQFERHVYTTSSCGICGKASINAVRVEHSAPSPSQYWKVSPNLLYSLPGLLRTQQADFETTGGLHASALFTQQADLVLIREDVGRHNALDKLIGATLQQDLPPLHDKILLLSGRASFELIQKASLAGITFVAAVGAPSSLAVQLAVEMNIVLVGFLRNERFNVYSGIERLVKA
jgi:FdhD protein